MLVEENNHEGVTRRAVLIFDEAMLSEMDPAQRDRLERLKAQGFRQAAAHEAPLTVYYSSVSNVRGAASALNAVARRSCIELKPHILSHFPPGSAVRESCVSGSILDLPQRRLISFSTLIGREKWGPSRWREHNGRC